MGLHLEVHAKLAGLCALTLILGVLFGVVREASAHRPIFSDSRATDKDFAVRISDPSVSHVIYSELTPEAPNRWFVLDNDKPQDVRIQLGVPAGQAGEGMDPTVVLVGPGFPEQTEPLPYVPRQDDGVGAMTISRLEQARHFDEPVTGTESQIVSDTTVHLPSAGPYYGLVFDRDGSGGKVWVGIGESEGFGPRDILRLPAWIRQVRRFHEVPGWPRWVQIAAGSFVFVIGAIGWGIGRLR